MYKCFSCALILFVCVSAVAAIVEVKIATLGGHSMYVESDDTHYAIAIPAFRELGWACVTVNGKEVVAITPNCGVIAKDMDSLKDEERAAINEFRRLHPMSRTPVNQPFSLGGHFDQLSNGVQVSSVILYSPEEADQAAAASPSSSGTHRKGLVVGMANMVAFVNFKAEIYMKPSYCLNLMEMSYITGLRDDIEHGRSSTQLLEETAGNGAQATETTPSAPESSQRGEESRGEESRGEESRGDGE